MPLLARLPSRASIRLALLRKSIPVSSSIANLKARRPICITLPRRLELGDDKEKESKVAAEPLEEQGRAHLQQNIQETQASLLEDIDEEDFNFIDIFSPPEPITESPVYPGPIPIDEGPTVTNEVPVENPETPVRRAETEQDTSANGKPTVVRRVFLPGSKDLNIEQYNPEILARRRAELEKNIAANGNSIVRKIFPTKEPGPGPTRIQMKYMPQSQWERAEAARIAQERERTWLGKYNTQRKRDLDVPPRTSSNVEAILLTPPNTPVLFQHPEGNIVRLPMSLAIDKIVSEIEYFALKVERSAHVYRKRGRNIPVTRAARYGLNVPPQTSSNVDAILQTPPNTPVLFQHERNIVKLPMSLAIDKVVSEIGYFVHRVEKYTYQCIQRGRKELDPMGVQHRMVFRTPGGLVRRLLTPESQGPRILKTWSTAKEIPEEPKPRILRTWIGDVRAPREAEKPKILKDWIGDANAQGEAGDPKNPRTWIDSDLKETRPLIRRHLYDDRKAIDYGAPPERYAAPPLSPPFKRLVPSGASEDQAESSEKGPVVAETEGLDVSSGANDMLRTTGPLGVPAQPSPLPTASNINIPSSRREFSTFSRLRAQAQSQLGFVEEKETIRKKYERIEDEELEKLGTPAPATNTKIYSPGGPMLGFDDPAEDSELQDLEDIGGAAKLRKGDLCEVRARTGIEFAIYLRPTKGGEPTLDLLSSSGTMVQCQEPRITFSVESEVPEQAVNNFLAYHDLWESKVDKIYPPRSLSLGMTQVLKRFNEKFMIAYQSKLYRFEELYNRLAHETDTVVVTLDEATRQVFGDNPTDAERYATHYALMGDGTRYLAARGKHRATSTFKVRSKSALRMIDDVTEWIRRTKSRHTQRMSPTDLDQILGKINSFVDKAKKMIDLNRELRKPENKPSDGKLVDVLEQTEIEWDQNDKFFIEYMKARVLKYGLQHLPLDGLVPVVLRMTERYQGQTLDACIAYNFLREIGVWSPWENTSLMKTSLDLPGPHISKLGQIDEMKLRRVDNERGYEKLNLKDSMASHRHNWGDLEIYAVDDATAEEIDDAISIEEKNGETWIHAHIANPTSHIPHDHWIAEIAQKKTASVYLPERSYSMLPEVIAKQYLGLDKNRPVLSVSVKIDDDGEILDYRIQPGFIQNLKRITYSQMDRVLGISCEENRDIIEVGNFPASRKGISESPLSKNDISNFRKFQSIAAKLRSRRVRDGFIAVNQANFEVSVNDGLGNTPHRHYYKHPILYRGHPAIRLTIETDAEASDSASMSIIAEFMLMANGVIAKWCKEREIPVPFRVQMYDKTRTDVYETLMEKVLPSRNERGIPREADTLRYLMLLGGTKLETFPGPHMILGMPEGYVKATSPLRRYTDMITHWQIEAFLRGAALPFSLEYLEKFLPYSIVAEREIRFMDIESKRFWAAAAIQRARDEGKPQLPERFTMVITEAKQWPTPCTGRVREWNLPGKVMVADPAVANTLGVGDVVSAEIERVRLGESLIWFKMVDFVEKGAMKVVF